MDRDRDPQMETTTLQGAKWPGESLEGQKKQTLAWASGARAAEAAASSRTLCCVIHLPRKSAARAPTSACLAEAVRHPEPCCGGVRGKAHLEGGRQYTFIKLPYFGMYNVYFFAQIFEGEKGAHYTWAVLIPLLAHKISYAITCLKINAKIPL